MENNKLEQAAIDCFGKSGSMCSARMGFIEGGKWQKEQDELPLIIKWFNTIRQIAISRKTGNGAIMKDSDVLDEIAVKAKDAIEYLELKNK